VLEFGNYRKVVANVQSQQTCQVLRRGEARHPQGSLPRGLLQEHVQLKKRIGPLSRRWGPHDTRDPIFDCVNHWPRAPERRRRQVPFAQSQPTHSAIAVDGLPGVCGLAPRHPPAEIPEECVHFSISLNRHYHTATTTELPDERRHAARALLHCSNAF
jgi:hypothetical protein